MHPISPRRPARPLILGAFLLIVLVVAVAACGGRSASAAAIPSVTVIAKDFSYDIPKGIHAGLVSMTLDNQGKEPHQAQVARINDGVTLDQFMAAVQKGPETALGLVTLAGGVNAIDSGKQQTAVLDLKAGQYVMICFVSGHDGMPHAAKGMITPFTVDAATDGAKPGEPKDEATITLQDFSFILPTDLTAGDHTFKVTNKGPQPHELTLVKLAEGKTMQDVMNYQGDGPQPFTEAGGMGAIAPNTSAWLSIHLDRGTYMAMCFVPDPSTGKAHAEMGMMAQFTVK